MHTTIIGIAGGTASGKTTVASKIIEATKNLGSVASIKMDDYYKRLDHLTYDERTKVNYDHPNAFDIDLLVEHLKDLKMGKSILKPTYDFALHNRTSVTEEIKPSNVIIVEGIMTFVSDELRNLFDIKIFVECDDDIRFIRRLNRDVMERGRTIESVINQYLTTVRPMHNAFVEGTKRYADIIIPSTNNNDIAIDVIVTKIKDLLK